MPKSKFLICIFFLAHTLCNLLQRGDFEYYETMGAIWEGEAFIIIPSDSIWFEQNMGLWEIKKKSYRPYSRAAELVTTHGITLCQRVNLTIGENYQLTYSMLTPRNIIHSALIAKINGQ